MKRRDWLKVAGAAAAGSGLALAGCAEQVSAPAGAARGDEPVRQWKMVTSWPSGFPGLGTGAADLARLITRASGGRINVRVYGAGELVPAFEVFDAVSRGTAEMGHSAAYYWSGKSPAASFFCAVPFGLNAQEMNGWLYHGGGLELWRELYAGFNLVPFAAGNTGVQMAGWFKREIRSLADLAGLKMRIPGLGGEVMARVGATPVNLPGGEIFSALQTGALDAAEWVGPYNDLAFGLHRVAKYCYYPGWQEPGPTLECMVHKPAFEALPEDLQAVVEASCRAVNDGMLAEYTARNVAALRTLQAEHGIEFRPLPEDVMQALRQATREALDDISRRDAFAARVHASMREFRIGAREWARVSEQAYADSRGDWV
ncbi:MAG: TRAP transporter substrate-binding protein DctP [Aquimonas sp.]|nr:TRAP transporter substrate-binding protein DctP [Aquimonas sp.]